MVDSAGGDASEEFEDIGHSEDARKIMEEYLIGEIEGGAAAAAANAGGSSAGGSEEEGSGVSTFAVVAAVVAVVGLAFNFLAK